MPGYRRDPFLQVLATTPVYRCPLGVVCARRQSLDTSLVEAPRRERRPTRRRGRGVAGGRGGRGRAASGVPHLVPRQQEVGVVEQPAPVQHSLPEEGQHLLAQTPGLERPFLQQLSLRDVPGEFGFGK